jgi:hypothetical protein
MPPDIKAETKPEAKSAPTPPRRPQQAATRPAPKPAAPAPHQTAPAAPAMQ